MTRELGREPLRFGVRWLCGALAAVALSACTTVAVVEPGHLAEAPTHEEETMLADATQHRLGSVSPSEAALIIGGARSSVELTAMTQALDQRLDHIVATLPGADPATRGRALLAALFSAQDGPPLLRQYEADATTLYAVMMTGRFNCVSATTLYWLAAHRAGIDARPVLLPSHARALVVAQGRKIVVETTTPNGFDAPASVSREARDRARPKGPRTRVDLYADEQGTEVDWNALLAVTYGNLGIMAQDRGETALASSLLAREATLTPPAQAPIVRMQQMSLLTELATRALHTGHLVEGVALARRSFDAAPTPASKRLAEQNIAAIASQQLLEEEPHMDDASLIAFADPLRAYPAAYGDVRALLLTLLAQRRLKRGDVDGSAAALNEAAGVATSDEVRGQTVHNARLGEINRIAKLSATDPEAAWVAWSRLGPPDATLATTEQQATQVIAENRAIRFSNDGRCPELDGVLASAPSVEHPDALRASCRGRHAHTLSERGDFKGAIDDMRAAVRLEPGEARHRQNLVATIEKEIDRLVHASHCDQAVPLIAEGRALDPNATFFTDVVAFCQQR